MSPFHQAATETEHWTLAGFGHGGGGGGGGGQGPLPVSDRPRDLPRFLYLIGPNFSLHPSWKLNHRPQRAAGSDPGSLTALVAGLICSTGESTGAKGLLAMRVAALCREHPREAGSGACANRHSQ